MKASTKFERREKYDLLAWIGRWRSDSEELLRWGENAEKAYNRIEEIIKYYFEKGGGLNE